MTTPYIPPTSAVSQIVTNACIKYAPTGNQPYCKTDKPSWSCGNVISRADALALGINDVLEKTDNITVGCCMTDDNCINGLTCDTTRNICIGTTSVQPDAPVDNAGPMLSPSDIANPMYASIDSLNGNLPNGDPINHYKPDNLIPFLKQKPWDSTRNFRMTLWHEGVVNVQETDLVDYFQKMVSFVNYRKFDRCFFNLTDPGVTKDGSFVFPQCQPDFVAKNYVSKMPTQCKIGILLYVNPLYTWVWTLDANPVKGGIMYNNPGYVDGDGQCDNIYHKCNDDSNCFIRVVPNLASCTSGGGGGGGPSSSGCTTDKDCTQGSSWKCMMDSGKGICIDQNSQCPFPNSWCKNCDSNCNNGTCQGHDDKQCSGCDTCVSSCGSDGNQYRSVICADSKGNKVDDKYCTGVKPLNKQACSKENFVNNSVDGTCDNDAQCQGGKVCVNGTCGWLTCSQVKDQCTAPGEKCCIQYKKGCPNNLERGMQLIHEINRIAKETYNSPNQITSVSFDGEDYGAYGADAWGMAQAWQAASKYAPEIDDIGMAKGPSMNTCDTRTTSAYPELYWIGELKPAPNPQSAFGYTGSVCETYPTDSKSVCCTQDSLDVAKTAGINDDGVCCEMCKHQEDMDPNCASPANVEQACINSDDDHKAACKIQRVIDCNKCENCKKSIYARNCNNPQGMMNEFRKYVSSYGKDAYQSIGTCPLLSLESAHRGKCGVGGAMAWGSKTCIQMMYNPQGFCGTFDGFASWDWDQFEIFMNLYASETWGNKIGDIGIYEWQFVPQDWLNPDDLSMFKSIQFNRPKSTLSWAMLIALIIAGVIICIKINEIIPKMICIAIVVGLMIYLLVKKKYS